MLTTQQGLRQSDPSTSHPSDGPTSHVPPDNRGGVIAHTRTEGVEIVCLLHA